MIKILLDTASDMPLELRERYGIKWVPFGISFDDEFYYDQIDITPEEFYAKIAEKGIIPKTSQVTREQFAEAIREMLVDEDDQVLVITLASSLSGTYNEAVKAMEEFEPGKVKVIDSRQVTLLITDLVIEAAEMIEKGADLEEIIKVLEAKSNKREAFFMLDTLEYLRKGGRISFAQSVIGGILNIKALRIYKDGKILPYGKAKGKKQAIKEMVEYVRKNRNKDNRLIMVHAANKELVMEIAAIIEKELGEKVEMISEIGAVIGAHVGPGTVAVSC